MFKTDLAEEVETQKSEDYNPDCKIYFSVEDTPMVSLVRYAEELESECKFNESEDNLH